eukprot:gb/GEZJ01004732.1/.p1 GENE.gb/GEZJ01004732.1/~~gb/GEZJ01004732.1/.p1  ORF type:complete len:248 (+),score=8.84 gb/GEZJ01004732.1/:205-948(+)
MDRQNQNQQDEIRFGNKRSRETASWTSSCSSESLSTNIVTSPRKVTRRPVAKRARRLGEEISLLQQTDEGQSPMPGPSGELSGNKINDQVASAGPSGASGEQGAAGPSSILQAARGGVVQDRAEPNTKSLSAPVLTCMRCGYTTTGLFDLLRHQGMHLPEQTRGCQCGQCENEIMVERYLRTHMQTMNANKITSQCKRCEQTFQTYSSLRAHQRKYCSWRRSRFELVFAMLDGDEGEHQVPSPRTPQ